MGKRKSADLKPDVASKGPAKVAKTVDPPLVPALATNANTFKNKEKVLVVSARGITFRYVNTCCARFHACSGHSHNAYGI